MEHRDVMQSRIQRFNVQAAHLGATVLKRGQLSTRVISTSTLILTRSQRITSSSEKTQSRALKTRSLNSGAAILGVLIALDCGLVSRPKFTNCRQCILFYKSDCHPLAPCSAFWVPSEKLPTSVPDNWVLHSSAWLQRTRGVKPRGNDGPGGQDGPNSRH